MLKVAIIGSNFGVIGLAPAFDSVKDCQIVAICAKSSEQLDAYCERTGFKNVYTDWKLLLENEDLDAVALAVTPGAQYEIVKVAISKGLHVFAEKPLAENLSQAEELLFLAEEKRVTHGIDFMFPEIAEWKKVKELLDKEELGKLKHISTNWDWLSGDIKNKRTTWKTDVTKGGGVLSFYFSHGLYYLEFFAGKIINTKSVLAYSPESMNGGEVMADMLLEFEGGITGSAHVSCVTRGLIRHQLIFFCENGSIVLENKNAVVDNFTVTIFGQNGMKKLEVVKDENSKNEDERVKIVRKLAGRFINACLNKKGAYPSFKDGLRAQELIEKIRINSKI